MGNDDAKLLTDRQERLGGLLEDRHRNITITTPPTGLCFTCQHSFITRAKHLEEFKVVCTAIYDFSTVVPDNIVYCNRYERLGNASLEDFKKLAVPIEKDKKREAGFKREDGSDDEHDGAEPKP